MPQTLSSSFKSVNPIVYLLVCDFPVNSIRGEKKAHDVTSVVGSSDDGVVFRSLSKALWWNTLPVTRELLSLVANAIVC
jgi:hypothetical protein